MSGLVFRELEPRIAFDAAIAETVDNEVAATQAFGSSEPAAAPRSETPDIDILEAAFAAPDEPAMSGGEIVFIDQAVENVEVLLEGIDPSAEIILLDAGKDGVAQIADALEGRSNLDAIHILAHGSAGELQLGAAQLNLGSMEGSHSTYLDSFQSALSADADILIYGCNFGEGLKGREAAELLAALTGADIAASIDLTGHESLGGDWDLETHVGSIETAIAIESVAAENWNSLLANVILAPTKDTFVDQDDPNDNYGTNTTITLDSDGVGLGHGHPILQFDLSSIPAGSTVTNATLTLTSSDNDGVNEISVYRLLESWDEGAGGSDEANWNDRVSGTSWTTAGGHVAAGAVATLNSGGASGAHAWNITSLVQDWVDGTFNNLGLMLASSEASSNEVDYSSREGASPPQLNITYTPANSSPVINSDGGGAIANVNATENQTGVTTVSASDVDPDTISYSISGGADSSDFNINPTSGELRFNSAPDFETPADADLDGVYEVAVTASDGNGGSDVQTIQVTVADVNDPATGTPSIVGSAVDDQLLTVDTSGIADDDGLGAFSFQWYRDPGSGPVAIFEATNSSYLLTDADVGADITVEVAFLDGGGNSEGPLVSAALGPIADVNDAPIFTSDGGGSSATVYVQEHQTAVTTVTTFDADVPADTVTYSIIGGADQARFSIVPATGVLTFISAPEFETPLDANADGVYEVNVRANDGNGGLSTQSISVVVTDSTSATQTFQEGVAGYTGTQDTYINDDNPNTAFGNLVEATVDLDSSDGETEGLIRFDSIFGLGPGQIPPGATIVSAELTFNVVDDTEAASQITLHRMLSAWSEASTWNSLTNGIQLNNIEASSTIDSILANPDLTGTQTFSGLESTLQAWSDGDPNFGWAIMTNSSNGWDFSTSEAVVLAQRPILNVTYIENSSPIITSGGSGASANVNAAENQTSVTTVTASDQDGDVPTFAITGGADQGLFSIDAASGVLTFNTAPNFETPTDADLDGVYEVAVTASDGNGGSDV
ncbi:MAG: DUF4347 domain-containing protein, partial [Pseudomonadota bacterium]